MVFGFHVLATPMLATGTAGRVMSWVFAQGSAGVSFFFILSGFVLTWSARPNDTARAFWRRRFAKIYPNHFVTFLGAAGILILKGLGIGVLAAVANLLLIQAWIPSASIYFGMNTPSWSLACEAFFYAMFPLIYKGVLVPRSRYLWPSAVAALALVWAIPAMVAADAGRLALLADLDLPGGPPARVRRRHAAGPGGPRGPVDRAEPRLGHRDRGRRLCRGPLGPVRRPHRGLHGDPVCAAHRGGGVG
jgi:peptidoglycan/LPS O-acetylase OafA/YrhL